MWPFADKHKELEPIFVFDWEAIDKLEKLTPREIIGLICAGAGVSPDTACTMRGRPPHKSVVHLFKEYTGWLKP